MFEVNTVKVSYVKSEVEVLRDLYLLIKKYKMNMDNVSKLFSQILDADITRSDKMYEFEIELKGE